MCRVNLLYDRDGIKLYHGDGALIPLVGDDEAVITGPPWRENPQAAREVVAAIHTRQAFIQWAETETPPCPLPLVAVHTWLHDTGRVQTFYEFNRFPQERAGRVFRHPIIDKNAQQYVGHPHQFPLAIAEGLIEMCDKELTIVDPFVGSGTTLLAARELGRRAIGVEVNEEYCRIAIARLDKNAAIEHP
jgi:hypothetical protein